VASSPAPPLGLLAPDRPFAELWQDHFRHVNYTQLQNMGGMPAISLPLAASDNGLPVGVHFWTRHGGDDMLLALAASVEQAFPWNARYPAIAAPVDSL
jgi:amidase